MVSRKRDFGPVQVLAMLVGAGIEDASYWAGMIEDEIAALPPHAQSIRARELAEIGSTGTPLAYVLGKQRFMGLELIAERGVIVPRAVTERVGRAALSLMKGMRHEDPVRELRIVDMCSGSGNLACALAFRDPMCRVWSCDLVPAASDLALRNVARLGLSGRVTVRTGDLFGSLAGEELAGRLDLVVCAPPFISTGRLARDRAFLLVNEPREAFDAGPFGLTVHQRTAAQAAAFLRPGGYLVFEVGEGQSKQVCTILERTRAYDEVESLDEGDGVYLVVQGRRKRPA